jgi:hypothetical protein
MNGRFKNTPTMANVTSQSDCRQIRNLPFCYLCGKPFTGSDVTNHDHVPPSSVFLPSDKNFPIKLRTHMQCHAPLSLEDEVIGQLISLLHGAATSRNSNKLKISTLQDPNTGLVTSVFSEKNIEHLLKRWLQGFHAALYRSYLPESAKFAIQTPFPSGTRINNQIAKVDSIHDQHYKFVALIKKNRAANNVDRIETNNGKLRYECVWDKADNGEWCCIFALGLYNWANLGDTRNFIRRGCAGLYWPGFETPPLVAQIATELVVNIVQSDYADPFITVPINNCMMQSTHQATDAPHDAKRV